MKKALIAGILAATALVAPLKASADKLIFGTGNTQLSPVIRDVIIPWAEKVNAEANGALEVKLRHGKMLVNHENFIDRLQDDVVQITWGLPVFLAGNFPRSIVSTMPFVTESNAAAALAFCRLYEAGELGAEWDGFKPLLYVPFPQVSAHLNGAPLKSLEDLAGKKIMTGSPTAAGIIKAYGGTPLSIQLPDQYQALQRGTADGTLMSYTAFRAFKLDEVTTDHLHAPLGGATGVAFMKQSVFDGLSQASKDVITANTGCENAAKTGAKVDVWQQDGLDYTAKAGNHTFSEFDEAAMAELLGRVSAKVTAGYDARVPGGADLIAKWHAAVKQAAADLPQILN